MLSRSIVLVFVLGYSSAFLDDILEQKKWDGLKVTFGPTSIGYFNSQPRTTNDAVSRGFKNISDCDVNANWRGSRYVKDGDMALVLLYDVNGYIAGIQTTVPAGESDDYPSSSIQPPFVKDGDNFVLSAYFVDPSIICTTGRSEDDFNNQGTGTNLYIQNGTSAEKDSILIPHKEVGMPATKWTKGRCFKAMGVHYWYNTSENMSCDDFFPVFLLYNHGELTAFGWAMGTNLTSTHIEHPVPLMFSYFMDPVPKCLLAIPKHSTMHIYMTSNPYLDAC